MKSLCTSTHGRARRLRWGLVSSDSVAGGLSRSPHQRSWISPLRVCGSVTNRLASYCIDPATAEPALRLREKSAADRTMSASEENLGVVLHAVNDVRVEALPMPVAGPGEVVVRMDSVGICGSDVHYVTRGRIGHFVVRAPMVLGHESSGVVHALGAGVTQLAVGDRVAIEPGVPCRRCEQCKRGTYNLCPDVVFCATPPDHGNLCRFYKHAADFCHKLPDSVTLEEGALMEPLSVGIHACRRAGVTAGQRVLVCGAGPIGLVSLLAARAMGAAEVVVTDISAGRLQLAAQLGAQHTLLVGGEDAPALAERVSALLGGRQPEVTIECSGAESSIQLAIHATAPGGVVVLVGMGPPVVSVPIIHAATREVDIRGIFRYVNCYPAAIELVRSGAIDVRPLVTHRFPMQKSLEAFETARTGAGGAVKVVIKCRPDSE